MGGELSGVSCRCAWVRKFLGALALCASGAVHAEIVWLPGDIPVPTYGYFDVISRAIAGRGVTETIDMHIACRNSSCPPKGGIYEERFFEDVSVVGFDRVATAEDIFVQPDVGRFRTWTETRQQTILGPLSFRSLGRIAIEYEHGGGQDLHRAVAFSSGRAHFRVVGADHYYDFTGRFATSELSPFVTQGYVGLSWLSDQGAPGNGINDYWEIGNDVTKNVTDIAKTGVLKAGRAYTLVWRTGNDSREQQLTNSYEFTMRFEPCVARGVNDGDYAHPDDAARVALGDAWRNTLRDRPDTEWGGLIYRVNGSRYHYGKPVRGQVSAGGVAMVSGPQLDAAYAADVPALGCLGAKVDEIVAIYHTHPINTDPTYLSVADITAAIAGDRSVYMRGANGLTCGIHKYETQPGDVAEAPIDPGNLNDALPGPSRLAAQLQEWSDPRRDRAVWIPLDAGHTPIPCDEDGEFR